ncbi:MAG: SH3 domain-containing protein [Catenulispora sp.]
MNAKSLIPKTLAAAVVLVSGTALDATTAHAATTTPVRPAVSCIWNPANNSNQPAAFTASGVNIRTGPDTSCTAIGSGFPGQSVTARCYTFSAGYYWIYLTDNTTGKTGWSRVDFLTWSGGIGPC